MCNSGGILATRHRPFEEVLERVPQTKRRVRQVFARLQDVTVIPRHAKVLDVGAEHGSFAAACTEIGYVCKGIEPEENARDNAKKLSKTLGLDFEVVAGVAEAIPYEDATFDVVVSSQVMEHVHDVDAAILEAYRVLKPGGVFWFTGTNALCPSADTEIKGFPLFGWYPNGIKRRIMLWARDSRPHLVNFTRSPAINWFSPAKTRRLLTRHGFREIHDRWDLRRNSAGGGIYGVAVRLVCLNRLTKTIADVVVPGCAYASIK